MSRLKQVFYAPAKWSGRSDLGDTHGGFRAADPESVDRGVQELPYLFSNGEPLNGDSLGAGADGTRDAPPRLGLIERVLGKKPRSHYRYIHLVAALPRVRYGRAVASAGCGLWIADTARALDTLSHSTDVMAPSLLLILKWSGLSAAIAIVLLFFQTQAGISHDIVLVTLSSGFTVLMFVAKQIFVAVKERRARDERLGITVATTAVEREKLVDDQFAYIMTESQKFYAERIKGLESQIALQKELASQQCAIINQQRELITQQATELVRKAG